MFTHSAALLLLTAVAEARFGQEQGNGAITAIGALTDLGQSGQAATLAGGSIQFLLAAANPCGKLTQADNIIAELGTSDAAIAAARGLVAAEQNFNPFVVSIPSICSDPTLPVTPELRGVVPLIDPAVVGSDKENANSNTSKTTPFSADGLSVAQVMIANGFSNFTAVDASGKSVPASSLGGSGAVAVSDSTDTKTTAAAAATTATTLATVVTAASSSVSCGGVITVTVAASASSSVAATTVANAATSSSTSAASSSGAGVCTGSGSTLSCTSPEPGFGAINDATIGTFSGFVASTNASLDFGLCVPTMKFEAGLDGRASTASTFQAIDPLVNKGQEEALNPSIITNRIHDQLTNVCGANQAAKDAVAAAAAQIAALGTRDITTAQTWNTLLGFDGTDTNPDNAPVAGLVGHA